MPGCQCGVRLTDASYSTQKMGRGRKLISEATKHKTDENKATKHKTDEEMNKIQIQIEENTNANTRR